MLHGDGIRILERLKWDRVQNRLGNTALYVPMPGHPCMFDLMSNYLGVQPRSTDVDAA